MAHNGKPPPSSQSVRSGPHQIPIRCTKQEHKSETYFSPLPLLLTPRGTLNVALGSKGRATWFLRTGLNSRPQKLFLSAVAGRWQDKGLARTHVPDIAACIRRKKKVVPWSRSLMLATFFYHTHSRCQQAISCHADAANIQDLI
jgi:hypothetical protein